MSAIDELKKSRDVDYKSPGMEDPDEPNDTSRIIMLTDDEQKTFEGAQPGQELRCDVRGNLEKDGHFHVMSVQPYGGGSSYGEQNMAQDVAKRVNPMMQ